MCLITGAPGPRRVKQAKKAPTINPKYMTSSPWLNQVLSLQRSDPGKLSRSPLNCKDSNLPIYLDIAILSCQEPKPRNLMDEFDEADKPASSQSRKPPGPVNPKKVKREPQEPQAPKAPAGTVTPRKIKKATPKKQKKQQNHEKPADSVPEPTATLETQAEDQEDNTNLPNTAQEQEHQEDDGTNPDADGRQHEQKEQEEEEHREDNTHLPNGAQEQEHQEDDSWGYGWDWNMSQDDHYSNGNWGYWYGRMDSDWGGWKNQSWDNFGASRHYGPYGYVRTWSGWDKGWEDDRYSPRGCYQRQASWATTVASTQPTPKRADSDLFEFQPPTPASKSKSPSATKTPAKAAPKGTPEKSPTEEQKQEQQRKHEEEEQARLREVSKKHHAKYMRFYRSLSSPRLSSLES